MTVPAEAKWDLTNRRLNGVLLLKRTGSKQWESLVYQTSTAILTKSQLAELGIEFGD